MKRLLEFFEGSGVICAENSLKSLILGTLWLADIGLSSCENVLDNFVNSSSVSHNASGSVNFILTKAGKKARIKKKGYPDGRVELSKTGSNKELSISFDSVEDETNGMPASKKRVVYKGEYSVTFKTSEGTLKISWWMDNFVAHLDYFAYFDETTDQKHFFLPKTFNSDYLEVFSSTGSGPCDFVGNVASSELMFLFDDQLHLLKNANEDCVKNIEFVRLFISYFIRIVSNAVDCLNIEKDKGRCRELVISKKSGIGSVRVKYH